MVEEDLKNINKTIVNFHDQISLFKSQSELIFQYINEFCQKIYISSISKICLPNDKLEKMKKIIQGKSILAPFIRKVINFLENINATHSRKIKNFQENSQKIHSEIQKIYNEFLEYIKNIEDAVKNTENLYIEEYKKSVDDLEKVRLEIIKIENENILNLKDPFMKYVISEHRRNKKKLAKLKILQFAVREKLKITIDEINLKLDHINKQLPEITVKYGNALSILLNKFKELLGNFEQIDNFDIVDNLSAIYTEISVIFGQSKEKLSPMKNADFGDLFTELKIERVENLNICEFIENILEEMCENENKNIEEFEKFCTDLKSKKLNANIKIAILDEWDELITKFIKDKLLYNKKLILYINDSTKSKINSAVNFLKENEEKINNSATPIDLDELIEIKSKNADKINLFSDSLGGLIQYILTTLDQTEKNSSEYFRFINATKIEIKPEILPKIKFINLLDNAPREDNSQFAIPDETPSEYNKNKSEANPSKGNEKTEFLNKKFGINEEILDSYSCAISWKILLQGRLYISKSALCFSSPFNNTTIFGNKTKICIPINEIINIETAYNALIFDNSINVKVENAEFFFTSFMFRDKAYELIKNAIKEYKKNDEAHLEIRESLKPLLLSSVQENSKKNCDSPCEKSSRHSEALFYNKIEEIEKIRLEKCKAEGLVFPKNKPILDETNACPIQAVLTVVLSKTHPTCEKLNRLGDNKECTEIIPLIAPDYYQNYRLALQEIAKSSPENQAKFLEQVSNWPIYVQSKCKYIHELKEIPPIPFFPKDVTLFEEAKTYFISPNNILLVSQINGASMPYSDYFISRTYQHIVQKIENGKYSTHWAMSVQVEFVKSTIFKTVIENTVMSNSEKIFKTVTKPVFFEHIENEMIKFNKILERSKMKNTGLVPFIPKIINNTGIMGQVVLKECKKNSGFVKEINRILENQKKIFGFIKVIFAILFFMLILKLFK